MTRPLCTDCRSAMCDGRKVECLGCGSSRCHAEGVGDGRCKACHYGLLPSWSGSDKPCGYKGCTNRAAFAGVPGAIKHVCTECVDRPKISVYTHGVPKATKVTLREYLQREVPTSPRVIAWRGAPRAQAATAALLATLDTFVSTERSAGREVGSLLASDVHKHDVAAIKGEPDLAFGWIIHPFGTHMCQIRLDGPDGTRIRAGVDAWPMMVAHAFSTDTLPNAGFYLWDGVALIRCTGPDDLHRRMVAHEARARLALVEPKIKELREERRIADAGTLWASRLDAEIARRMEEQTRLQELIDDAPHAA